MLRELLLSGTIKKFLIGIRDIKSRLLYINYATAHIRQFYYNILESIYETILIKMILYRFTMKINNICSLQNVSFKNIFSIKLFLFDHSHFNKH